MRLCFLHGLDSSPQGTKAVLLKQHYPNCLIPELPPDIVKRVEIVEHDVQKALVIIGSSLGGLTAIMHAMRHPHMVKGLVLLAPAVGSKDKSILTNQITGLLDSLYIPENIPISIIAGLRDDVIPIEAIRSLVHRSPHPERIKLNEVDDDHNLHQSLDLMLEVISQILREASNKENN